MENAVGAKTIFTVLGMSRSGTSVIARSLKALGVDLGDQLLPGDNRNPKGFYEDSEILYNINRGVSSVLEHPWTCLDRLSDQEINEHAVLNQYKEYAVKLLKARLANTNHWGFKDPRTVTILPFWQAVFKTLNVEDKYIIVMRNPLAAAFSNQKFAGLAVESALILWLYILISAIEGSHGKKRVLISYELMLKDPRRQLMRMHSSLDMQDALNEKEVLFYTHEFLDAKLSHHEFDDAELKAHPALLVIPLCLKIYALLQHVAKDEISFESDIFRNEWRMIKDEFNKNYPIYNFIRQFIKRNKQLERELRNIKKSMLWKLLYPFRLVDDFFYVRKRQTKDKKRLLAARLI